MYIDDNSKLHVEALINAIQTLHYSWLPEEHNRAINSAERTLALLDSQVDRDESSRMISEIGRIKLLLDSPLEATSYLKLSAPQRLASGNLARLRYDLSWLADAYLRMGDIYKSTLCAQTSLILHQKLYGNKKTDSGLVKRLQKILSKSGICQYQFLIETFFTQIANLFNESTGIDPVWWYNLLLRSDLVAESNIWKKITNISSPIKTFFCKDHILNRK